MGVGHRQEGGGTPTEGYPPSDLDGEEYPTSVNRWST